MFSSTSEYRVYFCVALILTACTAACSRTPAQKETRFLQKGKTLFDKHDYQRATLEFKNAAQVMPRDAEPYYQLALADIALQDSRSAFLLLKKAVSLDPKHAQAQLALAQFQTASLDKDTHIQAQERILGVLAAKPNDPEALNALAALQIRMGKVDEATNTLIKALETSPADLQSAVKLASIKMSQHDNSGAEIVLKAAVQHAPQSANAALSLADFYAKTGNKWEAEMQARRAVQLNSKSADGLLLLANIEAESGRTADAEQTYRRISELPNQSGTPIHAAFLFNEGKHEAAATELRDLVKRHPDDRKLRSFLVSDLLALGKTADAEHVLGDALKRNPKDIDALMQRSGLLLDAGKLGDAEKDLQSVLHNEQSSADAHYGLARLAGMRGSILQQRQELAEALKWNPQLLAARLDYAALLRNNDAKASLDLLDQTPDAQKKMASYMIARNWALMALKNKTEVRKNLDAGLASNPPAELLFQEGVFRYTEKEYGKSRLALEAALKMAPEYVLAVDLLAQTYADQGNMKQALDTVQSYSSKVPGSPVLLITTGNWQERANHPEKARQAFSSAIAASPDYIPARVALVDLDLMEGKLDGARAALREILSRHPVNVAAMIRMAAVEERSGNQAAARELYQSILQAEPNNLGALNDLAYSLSADKPDEALKYAQSAVELSPEAPALLDTLGWVYYRKGIYDSALKYLARAVKKEPSAVRRYHLSLAYAKTGDAQLAHQNLEAALKLDPTCCSK